MKRPSQRQKRIVGSLGRCFCLNSGRVISNVAIQTGMVQVGTKLKVAIVRKCWLCRLAFPEGEVTKHVLSHYDPIAEQVAQIESLATIMGGDRFDYLKACEQVMGWRPETSAATEFFRRQVSQC
ncbi:MAG: hypothetical protein ABFE07_15270 [Armatimonadia bacterium]